jgi:two-component system, NarL family, sensor histidine kinase DesK
MTPQSRSGWFSTDSASGIPKGNEPPQLGEGKPETSDHTIPGGQPLIRLIMLVVVCSYMTVAVLEQATTWSSSRPLAMEVGVPSSAVILVLTVCITSPAAERWSPRQRLAMLLAEGLVTFLPIFALGAMWADLAGFFAGAALLLLSGWLAWAVFATVLVGMLTGSVIGVAVESKFAWPEAAYLTIATLVLGLVVFGLARLSLLISYVHTSRGELAKLAVVSERMRFARDLHDLLGYSLSTITLKAELTKRLVDSNPARARDELAEVLDIARQALADVRIVATGYRRISLAKEASSVTSLLSEAGIETQVAIDCTGLAEKTDTVLATVLREAVANMLRHSTARHCTIKANAASGTSTGSEAVWLRIANDGVPRSARSGRRGGGLENLSSRLAADGGSLTARVRADGWFEVLAEASCAQATDQSDPDTERRQSAGT